MKNILGTINRPYIVRIHFLGIKRIKSLADFFNYSRVAILKRDKCFVDQVQKGCVVIDHGAAPVNTVVWELQFNARMPRHQIEGVSA